MFVSVSVTLIKAERGSQEDKFTEPGVANSITHSDITCHSIIIKGATET